METTQETWQESNARYQRAEQRTRKNKQGITLCRWCNKKATRYHARHDNGELEDLCEDHYEPWTTNAWTTDTHIHETRNQL